MEILGDDDEDGTTAWPSDAPVTRAVQDRDFDRSAGTGSGRTANPATTEIDLGEQAIDRRRTEQTAPPPPRAFGTGGASRPPLPGEEQEVPAEERADVAPGHVPAPDQGPEPVAAQPLDRLLAVVLAPEALGLSGLLGALTSAMSSLPSVLAFTTNFDGTPGDSVSMFATTYAVGGVLALALGIAGALRIPPRGSSTLARAACGAAVLLGVLLLVLAAFLTVLAGDIGDPATDSGIGAR